MAQISISAPALENIPRTTATTATTSTTSSSPLLPPSSSTTTTTTTTTKRSHARIEDILNETPVSKKAKTLNSEQDENTSRTRRRDNDHVDVKMRGVSVEEGEEGKKKIGVVDGRDGRVGDDGGRGAWCMEMGDD
jgi:hypothetical protein